MLGSSELIGIALFVALGLLTLVVVVWQLRDRQQREAALAARGWRTERRSRGYAVSGGEVVPWTLEVLRGNGRSSGGSFGTSWTAPAERTVDAVLIGPKLDLPAAMAVLGGGLTQFLLRMVLGDRARELEGAEEVVVGAPAFQARFTVISTSAHAAQRLVTDDVQAALLASDLEQLVVLRWRDEVNVRCRHGAWTVEEVERVVTLGERVAAACGY